MTARHWMCLLLLTAVTGFCRAAEGDPFYGYAYDLDTGTYLYTEVHQPRFDGGREVASSIRYYTPGGALIGTKTLDYAADPFVPKFRFDLPGEGYVEAITANGDPIELLKVAGKGKPEHHRSLAREGVMVADAGFNHFVQAHLPALLKGEVISFRFAVAGQLDSYRFRIQKVGNASFEGRPAVKLLVQADSLLRFVAPDLNLLYDPATLRLLEYRGVSNIHDPATGKAYNARIAYFSEPPASAPKPLPPLR